MKKCQVFGALNQLEFSPEVWQRALFQAFNLLADSNDELLVAAISFVFKAASQCQLLPHAVCLSIFIVSTLVISFYAF